MLNQYTYIVHGILLLLYVCVYVCMYLFNNVYIHSVRVCARTHVGVVICPGTTGLQVYTSIPLLYAQVIHFVFWLIASPDKVIKIVLLQR